MTGTDLPCATCKARPASSGRNRWTAPPTIPQRSHVSCGCSPAWRHGNRSVIAPLAWNPPPSPAEDLLRRSVSHDPPKARATGLVALDRGGRPSSRRVRKNDPASNRKWTVERLSRRAPATRQRRGCNGLSSAHAICLRVNCYGRCCPKVSSFVYPVQRLSYYCCCKYTCELL